MNILELEHLHTKQYQYPRPPSFTAVRITDTNNLSNSSKKRVIHVPNAAMQALHQDFMSRLRSWTYKKMPSAYGAVPGGSILRTIEHHRNKNGSFKRYWYALDLKGAYGQVDITRLAHILHAYVNSEFFSSEQETENFLRKYCVTNSSTGLVVGGGASPDLFNIYCEYVIDGSLREISRYFKFDLTYTRYIDDLLFSSQRPISRKKRQQIRKAVFDAGLTVEDRKTHVYDLTKNPITLNGLTVHSDGTITIPGHYLRKIQGIIHRQKTIGDVNIRRIHGMVNLIRHVVRNRTPNATEQKILNSFDVLIGKPTAFTT